MPEESRTPDLVDLSRRLNEAVNRGDLDAALAMYTPDAVWDLSLGGLGVFEGRDAIRGFLEDWLGAYEEWEQGAEELRELGKGVGFGVLRQRGRPAGSSGFVELRYAFVGLVRGDGLTERIVLYTDLDEARQAAERLAEERGQAVSQESTTPDLVAIWDAALDAPASFVSDYFHDDAEWHVAREDPDSAVHRGVVAIRKHYQRWIDSYPDLKLERLEAKANGDQVFAWVRVLGHGAGSGLPVDMRLAHVVTFRDGKIARVDVYYDRSEALEAVGLED